MRFFESLRKARREANPSIERTLASMQNDHRNAINSLLGSVCLIALLSGCGAGAWTRVTPVYASDGAPAHLIECGTYLPYCHERARELCQGAYLPVDKGSSIVSVPGGSATTAPIIATQHTLTIKCQPK